MERDTLQRTTTVAYGGAKRLADGALHRGTALGRYVVLEHVGSGGMGVIYSAYDPDLDRRVALKILRAEKFAPWQAEEAHRRLLREAKALARLAHPNVVAVHDVGVVDDQVFLAMEFVEGTDLRTWLRQERRGWRQILRLFVQAGRGLAAAHRAGLTHRDFKPANVMLGDDGRVRVLDFGLAIPRDGDNALDTGDDPVGDDPRSSGRSGSARSLSRAGDSGSRAATDSGHGGDGPKSSAAGGGFRGGSGVDRLTATGHVLGTPADMAPEQSDDPAGTAASDQFSFCVALWEALHGELPFAGEKRAEIRDNMRAGRLRPAPRGSQTPAWLRKAVMRGLAPEPADRHPSMEALLAALKRKPPRRWLAAAALATMVVGGALGTYLHRRSAQLCQGAERHLTGIWDAGRKAAIQLAILASPRPYAGGLWQGIERMLDQHAGAWVEMRTEACAATRLRGEQSEQLLDLRIDCLDRRLTEFQALSDLLADADAETVERSVQAAGKLSSLASCADARALTAVIPPPADDQARRRVEDLRRDLAETKTLLNLALSERFESAAEAITTQLEQIDYAPVEAEAYRLLGLIAEHSDDFETAEERFVLAARADQGRHDEIRFRSDIALVWLLGQQRADLEAARGWLERARGTLERLSRPPELLAMWHQSAAMLHLRAGDYPSASEAAALAADLSRRHNGPTHRFTVRSLSTLGNALFRQARYQEALATFDEVTAIRLRTLGPAHPEVAYSQQAQGEVLKTLGRYAEARDVLTGAVATLEQALGPNHSRVAITLESLGNTYSRLGQPEQALATLRRSLAIKRDLRGEESSAVAASLNNIALVLRNQLRYPEAEEHLRRALAIHEQTDGGEHPKTLIARLNLGSILLDQDRPRQARSFLEPTHEVMVRILGPEHRTSLHAGVMLGQALLELGSKRRGSELIASAAALAEQTGPPDWLLAKVRFAQARAAFAAGDRAAAGQRIDEAREILAGMGSAGDYGRHQIERWQAADAISG